MGGLKKIKCGREYTPTHLIDDISKEKDSFEYSIFLAVRKDGTQYMVTSEINHEEKSFLAMFLNSIVMRFFYPTEDHTGG